MTMASTSRAWPASPAPTTVLAWAHSDCDPLSISLALASYTVAKIRSWREAFSSRQTLAKARTERSRAAASATRWPGSMNGNVEVGSAAFDAAVRVYPKDRWLFIWGGYIVARYEPPG
jgi:hypothetical protein